MVGVVSRLRPLDRKLVRDLGRLRGQVLAVALVIASGVALLVMALTTGEALRETAAAYYERYRFADVFARVKRAPEHTVRELARIPGVREVESRIGDIVILDMPGFAEPVTGRVVSLPPTGRPALNRLVLRNGRLPGRNRIDEAVVGERFAAAHGLALGDGFAAVLNGRKRTLRVVGVALAPEFIYVLAPGAIMPDDKRFGVVWMNRDALEGAFDMEGAFNEVALGVARGTDPEIVARRVDDALARFGGIGAVPRARQESNWFLQNEIEQQRIMSTVLPAIFLAVAAFLTQTIMGRLIATERDQIGLMKAIGYSNARIGWHYAKMVLVITALGIAIGAVAGSWLGHYNTVVYAENFQFPFLLYRPGAESYLIAAAVSALATLAGSLGAVRRAVRLPPAEAMRPPAPPVYRMSRFAVASIARATDEPTRMILRRLGRWPMRALLSSVGIALSLAVLLLALQWSDSIDRMIDEFFGRAQHQDATVTLFEAEPLRARNDVMALPGVLALDANRTLPARVVNGTISRRKGVIGIPADARLSPIHDVRRGAVPVPESGVMISTTMAEAMKVRPGDRLQIEILLGRRPVLDVAVAGLFETYIDTPVYMRLEALNRAMSESPRANVYHVRIDGAEKPAFLSALKETPRVSAVAFRAAAVRMFRDTLAEIMMIFIGFFTVFSCTLAVGVVYNTIRIALAERGRELATLRVIGFNRREISYILLGETALQTLAAIPLGVIFGIVLAWYISDQFSTELFRVPLALEDATVGLAVLIILVTAAACAAVVRRRLDRLDLIEVLKTRD